MISALSTWLIRRAQAKEPHPIRVVTHDTKQLLFHRYQPFWPDEFVTRAGRHFNRPPWFRPFNVLLHHWQAGHAESMHDHPRWSITIVLRGRLTERTPWGERALRPGSVVLRSRKAIHAFILPEGEDVWTLFIVGPRNHSQNGYIIRPLGMATAAKDSLPEGTSL
jgi:hypothetical protein